MAQLEAVVYLEPDKEGRDYSCATASDGNKTADIRVFAGELFEHESFQRAVLDRTGIEFRCADIESTSNRKLRWHLWMDYLATASSGQT